VEEGSERVAPTICLTRLLWMSMQARNLVIFGGGGGGVFFVWLFGLVVVGLVGWLVGCTVPYGFVEPQKSCGISGVCAVGNRRLFYGGRRKERKGAVSQFC